MSQQFTLMIAGDSAATGTIEIAAPFDLPPVATIKTCGADSEDGCNG
ncbi:MAG: hypothetical protein ABFS08_01210 [Pseudomonadota bacterium]